MPRLSTASSRTRPTGRRELRPTRPPGTARSATPTANHGSAIEMRRSLPVAAVVLCGLVSVVAGVGMAPAQGPSSPCLGDTSADGVVAKPGPRIRFGITPAGRAGAIGPPVPVTPGSKQQTLAALRGLRPPTGPFVLR